MNYADIKKKRSEFNEHNDCGVIALSVSTGLDYDTAHAAMKKAGRKDRRKCWFGRNVEPAMTDLGFEAVEEKFPGKTLVTLERDLKRYARGRRFFITVRGHFVAFDGEKIVDWAQGKRHRIEKVYRVKPVVVIDWRTPEELPRDVGPINEDMVPPWLRKMPKPQGAPKIGTRVVQHIANNEKFEGEVVDYLASQFIIDTGDGERIIAVGDDWAVM